MNKKSKVKKNFSSFDYNEALLWLKIEKLIRWEIKFQPLPPSDFFKERLRRLEKFDLIISERGKELIIDAICDEVIQRHDRLKIWKSAPLNTDELTGFVDYLIAPDRAYLDTPLLCVVEAKRDDFEKGFAQCVMGMEACRWRNEQNGMICDVFGIVSNGEGWKFYQITQERKLYETSLYSTSEPESVLGLVDYVFGKCDEELFRVLDKAA